MNPIERIEKKNPADLLNKWVEAIEFVYVLTDKSIDELASQRPGFLRKTSGEGLQISKFTKDMLKLDSTVAGKIKKLASDGLLGFIDPQNGNIQFREDIAKKIGSHCKFTILNLENPDAREYMDAKVTGLDEKSYSSLARVQLLSDPEKKTEGKKSKDDELAKKVASKAVVPTLPKTPKELQKIAMRNKIALDVVRHMRKEEKRRVEKAAEIREEEKKVKRQKIRKDEIKHEIRNDEIEHADTNRTNIKTNDQIADRNKKP